MYPLSLQLPITKLFRFHSLLLIQSSTCELPIYATTDREGNNTNVACVRGMFLYVTSPLLVTTVYVKGQREGFFLFYFTKVNTYLLSTCVGAFFITLCGTSAFTTAARVTPIIRRIVGLLPLLFCLLVFRPGTRRVGGTTIVATLSFTAFRGIYCLVRGKTNRFSFVFFQNVKAKTVRIVYKTVINNNLTCI